MTTKPTCEPLAAALESTRGALGLTPELLNLIAVRVEEALADPRDGQLAALKDELATALRSALAKSPEAVIDALRIADKSGTGEGISYLLGNLSMAQSVASRAWERRAGDAFVEELRSDGFAPYLAALLNGPATNTELAAEIGQTPENVSRRIRRLREMGAAEFRRDGVHIFNFLTPAAEALARRWIQTNSPLPPARKKLEPDIAQFLSNVPKYMQENLNFAAKDMVIAGRVR